MKIKKPADLARLVKTRRQSQGLTQQTVANAAGITRQSLARIEQGHLGVSFETVLHVFEKLGISLEGKPDEQHNATTEAYSPKADAALKAASAAITKANFQDFEVSPLVAAATAATQNINEHTRSPGLAKWKSAFKDLNTHASEALLKFGHKTSDHDARIAFLNAAIEAGDPDRLHLFLAEQKASRKKTDRSNND